MLFRRDHNLRDGRPLSFVTGVSGRYAYGRGPSFSLALPSILAGSQPVVRTVQGQQRTHELSATLSSSIVF